MMQIARQIQTKPSILRGLKNSMLVGATALALITTNAGISLAAGTLRIGMTASDIPLTTGQNRSGRRRSAFHGLHRL